MYYLKTEHSFDSAHFLSGYDGKCKNIHGHRWKVVVKIKCAQLSQSGNSREMIVDFDSLKKDLKKETDALDHCLIVEKGTLREKTLEAFKEEGFRLVEVDFRPTAESFSKYFYDKMKNYGYDVASTEVYETPNNCAAYSEE